MNDKYSPTMEQVCTAMTGARTFGSIKLVVQNHKWPHGRRVTVKLP